VARHLVRSRPPARQQRGEPVVPLHDVHERDQTADVALLTHEAERERAVGPR
jgi:hypothetical protein